MFENFRAGRAARRAEQIFQSAGFEAAAAALDAVQGLGGGPWAQFARALYDDERRPEAERALRRALALEPGRAEALILLAELLAETDRAAEAIETYREVLERHPRSPAQALALARLLLGQGDFAGVRDVLTPFPRHSQEILMTLAAAHYELGEHQAVLDVMGPAIEVMRLDLKQGLGDPGGHRQLYAEYQEAQSLYSDAYAALHGREKVIEAKVIRGDLDPGAAVNYRLLGEARMAEAPAWEADVRLRSVEEGLAFGKSLIEAGERSRGLCHQGLSRLREGRLEQARKHFDQAREEDDGNYAAYLGLAAVIDVDQARAFDRLAALPELPAPPLIERVVIDWPALTADERKVVTLVVSPVAPVLARIAEAGAFVRLLPIDARLTDLPEMAEPEGEAERFDDHRCLQAITGAANHQVCASKIEELLCLTGDRDSVFAHELAHLVHFHLPEPLQGEIDALYERAMAEEHVATNYQTTNSAEFFAVAYTDFIAHTYDLRSRRELDEEGILEDVFDLIRALGGPEEARDVG
jgi:tetratricopeptide (TPR) repeat protein